MIILHNLGQEIAGAAFGGVVSSRRRRRNALAQTNMKNEILQLFPGRAYGRKEVINIPKKSTSYSSMWASVVIPVVNTFTLCFWLRTKDDYAQIISVIYSGSGNRPRINVSIRNGVLILHLAGKER